MSVSLVLQTSTAPNAGEIIEYGRLLHALRVQPDQSFARSDAPGQLRAVVNLDLIVRAIEAFEDAS